jgi:plastocyanin
MLRLRAIGLALGLAVFQAGMGYATTIVVTASGMVFSPPTVTIAPGDSIRWNWISGFHTTTSGVDLNDPQMGLLWDAPIDPSNTTFVRQFPTAGVFHYFCQNHVLMGMKGTITVNTAPIARDTAATALENFALGAKLQAFDPDGNALTYTILTGPFNGTATLLSTSTGTFTYTPALNFTGSDSLTFLVNDGAANSNTATMRISVVSTCSCPHQGDIVQNGFIDVQDVLQVIKIAFTNGADNQDPGCPRTRADVNNSGVVDVQDVLYEIKTAFTNGPGPVNPCAP